MPGKSSLNLFEHGVLSHEGQVFQIAALPLEPIIEKVFVAIKGALDTAHPGLNEWRDFGKDLSNGRWTISASGLVFEYRNPVSFLDSDVAETRIAFLILIFFENKKDTDRRYMFVQRRHVSDPGVLFTELGCCVEEITHAVLYEPFSKNALRYEYLAVKPLSVEKSALRKKTLLSRDVRSNISSLGLSRSIPSAIKVVLPGKVGAPERRISISSTTKRLREQGAKSDFPGMAEWATNAVREFDNARNSRKITSDFLGAFAQPVANLSGLVADSLLIDTFGIREFLRESDANQFLDSKGNELDLAACEAILDDLSEAIPLASISSSYAGDVTIQGVLHKVGLSLLVKTCKLKFPTAPYFISLSGGKERLDQFIEKRKFYRVTLNNGSALFSPEGTFRDGNIADSARLVLGVIHEEPMLATVTTEKGAASAGPDFEVDSSFYVIRHNLAKSAKWLVCDDSKDEWCDFLSYESTSGGPKITWYHAKVKRKKDSSGALVSMGTISRGSASASGLQEVVGQAVKNLGRLRLRRNSEGVAGINGRESAWLESYQWPDDLSKTTAGFQRLCKLPGGSRPAASDMSAMFDDFDAAARNPNTIYEVALVVPNYRLTTLTNIFKKLGKSNCSNTAPQVFWLLSGYISSCMEVGAKPAIYCL